MTKTAKNLLSALRIALPALLTLLWLGFIFGNSLQTGTDSGNASGRVYTLVNAIPEMLGWGSPISHYFVRKAAHFTEFAILAALVCADLWCFRIVSIKQSLKRSLPTLSLSIPFCVICAAADELIQNFSEGRGPSVKDVFIDASGVLFATIIFVIMFYIIKIMHNKYVSNNTTNIILSPNI